MWELYDALIEGIPEDYLIDELVCGYHYSYVRSGEGSGVAAGRFYDQRMPMFSKNLLGAPLREVAACVKSWNLIEAALGAAALNAYYNNPQVARDNGVEFSDAQRVEDRRYDPFIMSQNVVKGKRVVVVGHFPYLENLLEPVCDFSIIEWDPLEGDYPMPACEYLLPEADYAYLTCTALVDKTLPRLLALTENAVRVSLVGPATPLAPVLFDYGVDELSGFLIKDNQRAFRVAAGAEQVKIFATGQKVAFKAERRRNHEF
ncbi:hypothetical protein DEAC_c34760 [Desulfosporosinus acididurans]|uniref:Heavy-metal chelation domain-containing protein n=1 Tax=Desulfosporosinus acididurans TaxID=476652 RepID=A0A0J1FM42_9FIRM|nr:DUF364 domain-containing protein [Desulfosporosinus acididurans]KLU64530.1 hypothetical protein DEAC_c34760 [Desulfosporosinus acididurans]